MECPKNITILSETANTIELLYSERHYWDLGIRIFMTFFAIRLTHVIVRSLRKDDKSKNSKIGCGVFFYLFHISFFIFVFYVLIKPLPYTYIDSHILISPQQIIIYRKNMINKIDTFEYKTNRYDDFYIEDVSIYLIRQKYTQRITTGLEGDNEAITYIHYQLTQYWDLPKSK